MNTFADTLFSVLFSGIRSLVEGIWSSVVKGNYSSFFHWLGDHWLWLVLILCLICTAIDFIIWMIRCLTRRRGSLRQKRKKSF